MKGLSEAIVAARAVRRARAAEDNFSPEVERLQSAYDLAVTICAELNGIPRRNVVGLVGEQVLGLRVSAACPLAPSLSLVGERG